MDLISRPLKTASAETCLVAALATKITLDIDIFQTTAGSVHISGEDMGTDGDAPIGILGPMDDLKKTKSRATLCGD